MQFWFLIWVFLAIFIFGIFFWSMNILLRQRRVWSAVAKKFNMKLEMGGLMSSPAARGVIQGFDVTLYSEEQPTIDGRAKQFRSVIQIDLGKVMPTGGAVVSPDLKPFAAGLNLPETYLPNIEGWNKAIVIVVQNSAAIQPYFTVDRCKSLNALMSMKFYNAILIFDVNNTILRVETADPLHEEGKLEKLILKMLDQAKILVP